MKKFDVYLIALFLLGAFLVIASLFMPPLGVIASSVVTVFGIISILSAVLLAIQTNYEIEIHLGKDKSFTWKPVK